MVHLTLVCSISMTQPRQKTGLATNAGNLSVAFALGESNYSIIESMCLTYESFQCTERAEDC